MAREKGGIERRSEAKKKELYLMSLKLMYFALTY